jgi:hypothetical protein
MTMDEMGIRKYIYVKIAHSVAIFITTIKEKHTFY